jgi:hypothetical protein
MSDRRAGEDDEQPEPQEVELPSGELNLEGVAPTVSARATPEPLRTPFAFPGAGGSVEAHAGVAEVNVVALDATAEASSGVSGTLEVTEEPDVLDAHGAVGSNDQTTTGLLSVGATVAAGSEPDTAAHTNELEASQVQTPDLRTRVIRAAVDVPPIDDSTEAEFNATLGPDVMAGVEVVIVHLRRELDDRPGLDEQLQEMRAELATLNAQLSSPKPKRQTVATALWAVGGWACGIGNNMLANYAYEVLRKTLGL